MTTDRLFTAFLGLAALFMLTAVTPQVQAVDAVKVFILAGQSNMVGHGKTEYGHNDDGVGGEDIGGQGSLRYMVANDWATYGSGGSMPLLNNTYAEVIDTSNTPLDWRVRSDVNIYARTEYREDGSGNVSDTGVTRKGGLTVGGFAATNGFRWIGPELGFGHIVGDACDEDVLLVKISTGGTSLAVDWRSPTAANRSGSVGYMWDHMVNTVNGVLANLGGEFPEYAGRDYEVAGFGWHQGWNDRINTTYSAEYEANMADFINDVRDAFGVPDMPFVIGTTGMAPPAEYTTVELAQLAVGDPAQHPEFDGTVTTIDTRPYWRDSSESPSSFGYHWNHNGPSHWDIGVGMGEAMTEMVVPEPASLALLGLGGLMMVRRRRA